MTITKEMRAAAPTPIYGCHDDRCREDVSYPANMLYWHPRLRCYFCEYCHDAENMEDEPRYVDCPSLEDVLKEAPK